MSEVLPPGIKNTLPTKDTYKAKVTQLGEREGEQTRTNGTVSKALDCYHIFLAEIFPKSKSICYKHCFEEPAKKNNNNKMHLILWLASKSPIKTDI